MLLLLFHYFVIYARWQIFEGKENVSSYFLHHYQDNNEAGRLLVDKLSLKTLGLYIFIIFWLKIKFELCNSHEYKQENDFSVNFCLHFFFISWGRNSEKAKYRENLHFERHCSLCNWIGKKTMFFIFSFFHFFLCKFRISTSPLSVTKNEISKNFLKRVFGNIGLTWSSC